MVDSDHYVAHARSLLAWEVDPRYKGKSQLKTVETPRALSLMVESSDYACQMTAKKFISYPDIPGMATVHRAFLLRFVVPKAKKKAFEAWFKFGLFRDSGG